ncbi:hypothetical protein SDC9_197096 [bioreactor metagenome]|uniref:Uncharacterized protein n=1 Tax=bioreactor metagenome TaxID=1076179 RepID=A0A645IDV4_9ZZZZ
MPTPRFWKTSKSQRKPPKALAFGGFSLSAGLPVVGPVGPGRQVDDLPCVIQMQVALPTPAQSRAVGVQPVYNNGGQVALNFGIGLHAHGGEDAEARAL